MSFISPQERVVTYFNRLISFGAALCLLLALSLTALAQDSSSETPAAETPAAETPAAETPAAETPAATVEKVAAEDSPTLVSPPAAVDQLPSAYSSDSYIASAGYSTFTVNNLWICISAALVFIMHLGFTTLESGLTQKKNAVNIIFKNLWIVCTGVLLYAVWGFNAMYPGVYAPGDLANSDWNGYFAIGSWFGQSLNDTAMTTAAYNPGYTWWGDFIFQAMFAATGATIVSGAVAERVKLPTFMLFSTLLVGIAYPITGSWKWGGGWLADAGFYDFAGSSVVHAFGGFAALACVIILGPRLGKYTPDGIRPIVGHSMPLAAIGVFLLWLGWFGFNGGSVLSADPKAVSYVFVTTSLAACAGAVISVVVSWALLKKPDVSMALNGILAGLVGITAGADTVSEFNSILIGGISGLIVVIAILALDKIRLDDPVGAISVHGICGIWGTVAVGIFSFNPEHTIAVQAMGTLAIGGFAFVFSFAVFGILKLAMGVRVSAEDEAQGLDLSEHGAHAYKLD
jgi:Amt family ammonium transporter